MILVDTSVWIDHLRHGNVRLVDLLLTERVLCHPFIVGEIACGNPRNRGEIVQLLNALPQAAVAEHAAVLDVLESHRLYGKGIGWVDAHLLTSALHERCGLWTLDRQLAREAKRLM